MASIGTNDTLTALNHPLRRRILRTLDGKAEASPVELAEALSMPLGTVAYHVKILDRCGALELVRTRPVRGAVQHFYRAVAQPDWARTVLASAE